MKIWPKVKTGKYPGNTQGIYLKVFLTLVLAKRYVLLSSIRLSVCLTSVHALCPNGRSFDVIFAPVNFHSALEV